MLNLKWRLGTAVREFLTKPFTEFNHPLLMIWWAEVAAFARKYQIWRGQNHYAAYFNQDSGNYGAPRRAAI